MNYLLDTSVWMDFIKNPNNYKILVQQFGLNNTNTFVSIVTKGELMAIAQKRGWSMRKVNLLNVYLSNSICVDIMNSDISLLQKYGWIDAFSERKIVDRLGKLNKGSMTMGKNDLWISATASELKDCALITHNYKHFSHLEVGFLKVINFFDVLKNKPLGRLPKKVVKKKK